MRGLRSVGAYVDQPSTGVAPGFQHRMHDQVNGELRAAEYDAERVDEERHVVRDSQHQRAGGLEAIALTLGIEDADQRLAGRAARAEFEMPERRTGEHARRALGQILLPDPPEVSSQEALLQVGPGAALARTAGGGDALDERYAGGGNAPQQPIVVSRGNLRVHAQLSRSDYTVMCRRSGPRCL